LLAATARSEAGAIVSLGRAKTGTLKQNAMSKTLIKVFFMPIPPGEISLAINYFQLMSVVCGD